MLCNKGKLIPTLSLLRGKNEQRPTVQDYLTLDWGSPDVFFLKRVAMLNMVRAGGRVHAEERVFLSVCASTSTMKRTVPWP